MEFLTYTERQHIQNKINSQKGQNYPCSNQIVLCGFFGTFEQWKDFVIENKSEIAFYKREYFRLNNGECWKFFDIQVKSSMLKTRGYRFYKIKINPTIYKEVFFECVYPYCSLYCKELEWL